MKNSIKNELCSYLVDLINEGVLTVDNVGDWHFYAFNENYYIIGYYEAEQWMKKHGVSSFEAISECVHYERDNFGECYKTYDNAETTVNMYVYILGEELISEMLEDLRIYGNRIDEDDLAECIAWLEMNS